MLCGGRGQQPDTVQSCENVKYNSNTMHHEFSQQLFSDYVV